MEQLGFSLLGKNIWFNSEHKLYTLVHLKEINPEFGTVYNQDYRLCRVMEHNDKICVYIYVGHRHHQRFHRYLMEKQLGRKLNKNEHVHHIDGNTVNNEMNNLILLSRSEHKMCHNSLQNCILELYKQGKVAFADGEYKLV